MTPDTVLKTLTRYNLRLECPVGGQGQLARDAACHHSTTVRVSDLIKQLGTAATICDLQARICCRSCGKANPIVIINPAG